MSRQISQRGRSIRSQVSRAMRQVIGNYPRMATLEIASEVIDLNEMQTVNYIRMLIRETDHLHCEIRGLEAALDAARTANAESKKTIKDLRDKIAQLEVDSSKGNQALVKNWDEEEEVN